MKTQQASVMTRWTGARENFGRGVLLASCALALTLALSAGGCSSPTSDSTTPIMGPPTPTESITAEIRPGAYHLPDGTRFTIHRNDSLGTSAGTFFCSTHSVAGPVSDAYDHVQKQGPGCLIDIR